MPGASTFCSADHDPTVGSEIQKTRQCIIVLPRRFGCHRGSARLGAVDQPTLHMTLAVLRETFEE
jgi:mRNA-degrading endonuclease toxin of MazEF toxin-antitoxin module